MKDMKLSYLHRCCSCIQEHSSVPQAVRLMKALLESFPATSAAPTLGHGSRRAFFHKRVGDTLCDRVTRRRLVRCPCQVRVTTLRSHVRSFVRSRHRACVPDVHGSHHDPHRCGRQQKERQHFDYARVATVPTAAGGGARRDPTGGGRRHGRRCDRWRGALQQRRGAVPGGHQRRDRNGRRLVRMCDVRFIRSNGTKTRRLMPRRCADGRTGRCSASLYDMVKKSHPSLHSARTTRP